MAFVPFGSINPTPNFLRRAKKTGTNAALQKGMVITVVRLDKFLSDALPCTRREASAYIRQRRVRADGRIVTAADAKIDPDKAEVTFDGTPLSYSEFIYIMINKPEGLISATEDEREKTVMSLLPESYGTKGLFPAGRLDKDTTGLLILTNDGETAHRLLSPKYNKEKVYRVTAEAEFTPLDVEKLEKGVMLDDGMTKPVKLVISPEDPHIGCMTLTEGRFHEVKRICLALSNKCIALKREKFGGLSLDESLALGEWRLLTEEETKRLLENSLCKS